MPNVAGTCIPFFLLSRPLLCLLMEDRDRYVEVWLAAALLGLEGEYILVHQMKQPFCAQVHVYAYVHIRMYNTHNICMYV